MRGPALRGQSPLQTIQIQKYYRRRIKGQNLTQRQATDHGKPKRPTQFRPCAMAQHQRQARQQRRHRRHQDRAKTKKASLADCVQWRLPVAALGIDSKVYHHNPILLNNAYQQNNTNDCNY